ncbi:MAG TPA: sulfite exporter TauE/SafE family protein [Terriglobales bacterium]|nr:sulfite exporter TauE/SafE family protein [Terriglobales bacterium]
MTHHVLTVVASVTNLTTLYVLLVVFLATLIRSAFGFGEALFAVPLLALRLPLKVAAPLAVLLSITIALIVVAQDWRKVQARSMGWLMFATAFGIPLGLALLTSSHQQLVKAVLALLIIAFAVYSLVGDKPPLLSSDSLPWLLGCGFTAGVLGGAYGMNGPPLAIYGAMRRWSAQQFRATLQGYFLPASVLGMLGYWLKGLWVPAVTHFFLLSLVPMLPAILLGKWVNRRMHGDAFLKYVYTALVAIGLVLLAQARGTRL